MAKNGKGNKNKSQQPKYDNPTLTDIEDIEDIYGDIQKDVTSRTRGIYYESVKNREKIQLPKIDHVGLYIDGLDKPPSYAETIIDKIVGNKGETDKTKQLNQITSTYGNKATDPLTEAAQEAREANRANEISFSQERAAVKKEEALRDWAIDNLPKPTMSETGKIVGDVKVKYKDYGGATYKEPPSAPLQKKEFSINGYQWQSTFTPEYYQSGADFVFGLDNKKPSLEYNLDYDNTVVKTDYVSDAPVPETNGFDLNKVETLEEVDKRINEEGRSVFKEPPKEPAPAKKASKLSKFGKRTATAIAAGTLVLGGLTLALSDRRGQQTNGQLYGQQPLY